MSEEIYFAPIEIESPDQLESLNITWKDCRTWRIGNRPITVYLVPANKETSDYLTAQISKKYKAESRATRCMIRGRRKALIRCPDEYSCSSCPFGRERGDQLAAIISLESLAEGGIDFADTGISMEDELENAERYNEIIQVLRSVDPKLVELLRMRLEGFSVAEIARTTGRSETAIRKALKKIAKLVGSMW